MTFLLDDPTSARRKTVLKALPTIPANGWAAPNYFPDLSNTTVIGLDVETKDDELLTDGPGWARHRGHIVGFSVAAIDRSNARGQWYFPIRHAIEPENNLDISSCFNWLRATLAATASIPKVGANFIYDIGWLSEEGIEVPGKVYDVQFGEALLHDRGEVNLDYLATKYLGVGKTSAALYKWCAEAYGGSVNGDQRANIWRSPPRLVGPYAEDDALDPIDILVKQWPLLHAEGLLPLFEMECELIPLWVKMRRAGVRIDVPYVEQLYGELRRDVEQLYDQLHRLVGFHASVNSPKDMERMFRATGIQFPKTAMGKPSFRKDFLTSLGHPLAQLIMDIRGVEKLRSTFVKNYLLDKNVNGMIYCQYHPLRADDSGTITGRLASSTPNLQNIPVRSAQGKKVRKAFVADRGHACIEKNDHSQIEYRMGANFAIGPGADELRRIYRENPDIDYHDNTYKNLCPLMNWDYEQGRNKTDSAEDRLLRANRRRPIKNVNFSLWYGISDKSLRQKYLGEMSDAQVKEFMEAFYRGAPYVKPTMKAIAAEVQQFGYITTILGRRVRFDYWEPKNESKQIAMPLQQALKLYGSQIKRAGDYKGTNYKFQGSAADALKAGMWACLKTGVFDIIGPPRLQVHDELVYSVIDNSPQQNEAYTEMRHLLETALPTCRVPLKVDHGRGPSWGAIE